MIRPLRRRWRCYAGGTGEVQIQGRVLSRTSSPRVALPEEVSRRFRMQALNEFYYSWGPDVADINRDGILDIVAGPYYYLGPDYNVAREIYLAADDRPRHEVLQRRAVHVRLHRRRLAGRGQRALPRSRHGPVREPQRRAAALGDVHRDATGSASELALMKDVDGDGKQELIFKDADNAFVYANPDPANPDGHVDQARDQHTRAHGRITAWASATSTATAAWTS